jgi:uncharacterized protein YdeI (YjbR/CyaY-like superfamily)
VKPRFFPTAAAFRAWLERHHAAAPELLVAFHKVGSGKRSITYPQALDAALSFGWIDGVRRSLNGTSYTIRFTPRKAKSTWSAVNIRRVGELTAAGLMAPAGLKAFREHDEKRSRLYAFENRPGQLDPAYAKRFRANRRAWEFFASQPPGYRRTATWWVMSAKQDDTRRRRLDILVESSAKGRRAPPFLVARRDRRDS